MLQQQSFEYAIVRVVPQMEREEFLNVGVIVYCKTQRYIDMQFVLDVPRLRAFNPGADAGNIRTHLEAFEQIAKGNPAAGPIAALDMASRFRWLTAKRSTVVQCSSVHPGVCHTPNATLQRLFEQLVMMG
jgi:hypothetical protein